MKSKSVHYLVLEMIEKKRRGTVFVPRDFDDLGKPGAVKMALSRLAEQGTIKRVSQGIYVRPKIDREMGPLQPSMEEVMRALARRDGIRILPSGAEALNAMGLSTQVPTRIVVHTDGSPRTRRIGKRSVVLKKISPKMLAMKGQATILAVQALKALGKNNLDEGVRQVIAEAIKKQDQKLLFHDLSLVPQWVAKILRESIAPG